jgi:pimeloyl-ACP methyl ester carboxylesterase
VPSSSFVGLVLQSPFTSVLALDATHKFHVGIPDMFDSLRVPSRATQRHADDISNPPSMVDPCRESQKLKRISCHVLVTHGQNDNVVPKTHPKKMVRKLENLWKRLELEGVGHHDVEVPFLSSTLSLLSCLTWIGSASAGRLLTTFSTRWSSSLIF